MQKLVIGVALFATGVIFQYCKTSHKTASASAGAVTYENSIRPVVESSCTPCHIAGKGNKLPLNNYDQAKTAADDIIARIQKNPGERGFMPAMHPKLSDSTINLFVQWKNGGLQEK